MRVLRREGFGHQYLLRLRDWKSGRFRGIAEETSLGTDSAESGPDQWSSCGEPGWVISRECRRIGKAWEYRPRLDFRS
jgi:hypothetical protein